jgi:hypothetical protein
LELLKGEGICDPVPAVALGVTKRMVNGIETTLEPLEDVSAAGG